jgi:hypothetical protein
MMKSPLRIAVLLLLHLGRMLGQECIPCAGGETPFSFGSGRQGVEVVCDEVVEFAKSLEAGAYTYRI